MSEKNTATKGNPNTAGSIYLSILTALLVLLNIPVLFPLITIVISGRYAFKARDAHEDKGFLRAAFILFGLIIAFLIVASILNIAFFVSDALNK